MALHKLPTEITEQIIWQAAPDGFESIALTCKSLFHACQPLIDDYCKKKRRFTTFSYSQHSTRVTCDAPGDKSTCTILQHWDDTTAITGYKIPDIFALLCAVLRDPTISRFIRSLDLKHDRVHLPSSHRFHFDADDTMPSPAWSIEDKLHVRQFLSESLSSWNLLEDASSYNLDEMSVVETEIWLFTMLPYVTDIALSKAWAHVIPLSRVAQLAAIVDRSNDPTKSEAPLSRLTVMKPFVGHGYHSIAPLSQLAPFLSLKSLEEFYMGGIQALEMPPRQDYFRPGCPGLSLTKIELNGSCIGAVELSGLLSRTPNLKSLRLNLETKPNDVGRNYDVGRLLAVISSQVGNVIEDVIISTNPMNRHTTTPASMDGFKQLKNLELEYHVFWGAAFSDQELLRNVAPADADPAVWQPPCLVDILPSSLETAKIYAKRLTNELRFRPAEVAHLFRGLQESRNSKFPQLINVDFISPPPGGRLKTAEIREALRITAEAGLRVFHVPEAECGPSFTRTFNARFGVGDAQDDRPV